MIQHVGDVDKADRVVVDGIECTGWARTIGDVTAKLGRDVGLWSIDDFDAAAEFAVAGDDGRAPGSAWPVRGRGRFGSF